MTENFIEINGKNICYTAEGDGEVVFLLCGWGVPYPLSDFYCLSKRLAQTHKAVIISLFGYGDSDITDSITDFSFNLNVLKEVIGKIANGERFSLVGHSLGSFYCLCLANIFPAQIHNIFLLDSYPKINSLFVAANKIVGGYIRRLRKTGKLNKMSDEKLKKHLYINDNIPDIIADKALRITREKVYNDNVFHELNGAPKILKQNIKQNTASDVKIVAICRKLSFRANCYLKKFYKDVTVFNLGKCGHYVHHDKPQEVLAIIKDSIN